MKSLSHRILLNFLFLLPLLCHAQEDQKPRTLFGGDQKVSHGGWGAPSAMYTRIMDTDALLVGGRAGWLINHRVTIGLAGYGLTTALPNSKYDDHLQGLGDSLARGSQFEMGYGGLLIEPIIAYRSPVHVRLPILIGVGGCGYQYSSRSPIEVDYANYRDLAQAFLVVEPGVDLEINVVPLVRLALGASYRYTSELDLPATPKDALQGMNASFTIKVGWF